MCFITHQPVVSAPSLTQSALIQRPSQHNPAVLPPDLGQYHLGVHIWLSCRGRVFLWPGAWSTPPLRGMSSPSFQGNQLGSIFTAHNGRDREHVTPLLLMRPSFSIKGLVLGRQRSSCGVLHHFLSLLYK